MKGKRIWKRWMGMMLALVLLAAVPGGASAAKDYTEVEWKYEDSLLVDVVVDKSRGFTPEDFPGIGCKKVFVLEKSQTEEGVRYQLVLQLNRWGDEELNEAIEEVSSLPMVVRAQRNFEYTHPKSRLLLNRSCLYLAVNETADVSIEDFKALFAEKSLIQGVYFSLDLDLYNPNALKKDSFSGYGVTRFWPYSATDGSMALVRRPEESEGLKDEGGCYYGLAGDMNESVFEAVRRLAASPEIKYVSIVRETTNSYSPYRYEYWTVKNPELAECALSGGEQSAWGDETPLNQTATLCGLKPGITTLTCERIQTGGASQVCPVIVYEPGGTDNPGDMDHDGKVSAGDALQTLKHMAGLVSLEEGDARNADLNGNGKVDAGDALLMLKIMTGL